MEDLVAEQIITGVAFVGGAAVTAVGAVFVAARRNGKNHQDSPLTKSLIEVAAGLLKMADKMDADILESKLSRQTLEGTFGRLLRNDEMIMSKLNTIRSGEMAAADTEKIIAKIDSMKMAR